MDKYEVTGGLHHIHERLKEIIKKILVIGQRFFREVSESKPEGEIRHRIIICSMNNGQEMSMALRRPDVPFHSPAAFGAYDAELNGGRFR